MAVDQTKLDELLRQFVPDLCDRQCLGGLVRRVAARVG
jgi:hypothetical protein